MIFELTAKTTMKLDKLNSRIEHHGEAHVLAIDLKCTMQSNNSLLDQFHPKLRAALAHRDGLDARLREERADG